MCWQQTTVLSAVPVTLSPVENTFSYHITADAGISKYKLFSSLILNNHRCY